MNANKSQLLFRNDDVSWDTSLELFRDFCEVFQKHGLQQVHGVTLRGCTNTLFCFQNRPAEYKAHDSIAHLDNVLIRHLSQEKCFEDRNDLVEYLQKSSDQIALHGLFHTDYSTMTYAEQKADIQEGLEILSRLFPRKQVNYFIPPFNRTSPETYQICNDLCLQVLTTSGVHLESQLDSLLLRPHTWYRYHHHRFYPDSTFRFYELSLEKLDFALAEALSSGAYLRWFFRSLQNRLRRIASLPNR